MKRVSTKQQQEQLNSTGGYDDSAVLDICTTEELVANKKRKAVKGF